ncbi:putative disease resistance protein RGA4 [Cornus florida]|uniref:putative disease resistance protein RGA4 n=1 Tax=Cornus florida TaxID=4283 RepID=UPI00289661F0|nr:putative disease resistance protein RGA4 [Cornus florida]XP_059651963.1 putative disease resistance protein RGA4 [Cornus florida]XP_059651964.1 putative disease resistance protein RGA4 [Cornus florida]XP_059651965.1 putative disease resistance protein RGA4 [Cornus florida]XP_059651966.1 putative disease resistance protein RGA4 [Cornus florida]XP_059651967.1 putative disease resistance protein RGA4 [Cornus florida]XP_059651968.1 putative disease resistance protein RGA4 [Cornus florida]XP_0
MAETIIYNTVTELLKKLGSMVNQEIKLVQGVENEVHKLEKTVSTIRAVLLDAEEQKATNHEVEEWLEKLYDAFYDADDLLDDFSTEVFRQQKWLEKVRNFFSSSNPFAFKSKMAREIKAIRERLDAIAEDKEKFHLTKRPIENIKREETHSFVHAESVIGRDADKKEMVKLVLDSNVEENVSVVAIVGIGGLGKTTLAQLIFNDEEVTRYFELKMWVCVSDPFDVKLIAQKIIGSEASKDFELEELQSLLRGKINGKKYILVLDDVWNDKRDVWLKLEELLKGGSRGSKILLTTRSDLVANVSGAHSPHVLEGLSEESSWSLFKQIAFKNAEGLKNTCRVNIGEEIARKCKGVPLAIRAVGSLLYSKDTDHEWLFFKNNDLSKIAQEEDIILPILKLSYEHLPSHLKGCFAFCSLYAKDEEIDRRELIQLWIAHGFIPSGYENQQLEDVGHLYFMNLLRRSLFQDVKKDIWGDIQSCKMHDLVHDVAESVVRPKSSVVNSNAKNISDRTRHLSLHLSKKIPTHLSRAHNLRTLRMKESRFGMVIDSTFKRLRVLDMPKVWVHGSISKMKHLRFLSLSTCNGRKLPSSITKLKNLQTLKLYMCLRLKQLPEEIKELVNLRHLELDMCPYLTGMPCGLGQLPSLQFLSLWDMVSLEYMEDKSSSGSGSEDSLCSSSSSNGGAAPTPTFFPSLKTLQLRGLYKLKGWWRSQAEEEATTTLQDQQQQHLKKLPSFPSLSQLWIYDCPNLASMPILQPCLEQLVLKKVSKKVVEEELKMTLVSPTPPTDTLATSSSSSSLLFPPLSNLKSLKLLDIRDLVTLPEESFLSLTSLERLEIKYCPNLISLPDGMRQLTALQQLTIESCTHGLHNRYQKETGEDWPKIAHIPRVNIRW